MRRRFVIELVSNTEIFETFNLGGDECGYRALFGQGFGNDFQGEIVTLNLQAKGVRIVAIVAETNRSNENAPSHRVFVGRADYAELSVMRSGAM